MPPLIGGVAAAAGWILHLEAAGDAVGADGDVAGVQGLAGAGGGGGLVVDQRSSTLPLLALTM